LEDAIDPQRAERAIGHRIAHRRAEEEGADTLFVHDRRRSSRIPSAIRSERKRAIEHRIAHRRAEEEGADTLFVHDRRRSSRIPSAIRSERSEP
jgi:hypothetical protein